jgi:hypothetical protein
MKNKLNKSFQNQLLSMFSWFNFHKNKISIEVADWDTSEMILINSHACFMWNFKLNNLNHLKGVNALMCLWANKGIKSKEDFDGISLFSIDDYSKINSG